MTTIYSIGAGFCGTVSIQKMRRAVDAAQTETPLLYRKGGGRRECAGYNNPDNNGWISDSGVHCVILAEFENVGNDNEQHNRDTGINHNNKGKGARWE